MSYLFQIAVLVGKPFDEPQENYWVVLNEVLVDCYLYTMLALSGNSNVEQSIRINMGWTLLGIIAISFTVNFIRMVYLMGRECRTACRKR